MSHALLRVIKLGGSLLDCDDLAATLRRWLSQQSSATNVIVPGGGPAAELIREVDRRVRLDPERAHWLAVGAMSFSARLLSALLPEAKLTAATDSVSVVAELQLRSGASASTSAVAAPHLCDQWRFGSDPLLIVDVEPLLRREVSLLGPRCLPHAWEVTSDSIAARLAEVAGADELVLLKSCLPAGCHTWQDAADRGYVDRYFPQAVPELRQVRAVNFRDPTLREWTPRMLSPEPLARNP